MNRRLGIALSLMATLLGACADGPTTSVAPPEANLAPLRFLSARAEAIPDRYIVVFRDDAGDAAELAARQVAAGGGELHYTYRYALKGFAATLPAHAVEGLRRNPNVAYIEPDHLARPAIGIQSGAPWNLDRVDQRDLPLSGTYGYHNDGSGVRVYVIDSGIRTAHPEFGGRASIGYDACHTQCDTLARDLYGHGTRVAGIIGASTYGVAKGARLISVRVLDNAGAGTPSTVIKGIDWVTQQKRKADSTRVDDSTMVANVSLRFFEPSTALDDAVRRSIAAGVVYVLGAGNEGNSSTYSADACSYSPGRVSEAVTVGATNNYDHVWFNSNVGPCVDLYAPGFSITTTTSALGTTTSASGTSFAAPHVAGFAARYLQTYSLSSPAEVQSAVIYHSTKDRLIFEGNWPSLEAASYNRLLYTSFNEGSTGRPPGCCR
jgi:subtilisin family serine protease